MSIALNKGLRYFDEWSLVMLILLHVYMVNPNFSSLSNKLALNSPTKNK